MRTNIDIDDTMLAEVMEITGEKTKRATVEAALRQIITLHRQYQAGQALAGIGWDGDLEAMRTGTAA